MYDAIDVKIIYISMQSVVLYILYLVIHLQIITNILEDNIFTILLLYYIIYL